MRSNWDEGQFEEFQRTLVERLPIVKQEIQCLINDTVSFIARHDPEQLMHRAYWDLLGTNVVFDHNEQHRETEASVTSLHVIEYMQNIIASLSKAEEKRESLDEDKWKIITESIKLIYQKICREYFLCEQAASKLHQNIDDEVEQFRFQAQLHWMVVRGERYTIHEEIHLRDLLLCHSQSISSVFGVSAEKIIVEISKILRSLTQGAGEAAEELHTIDQDIFDNLSPVETSSLQNCKSEEDVIRLVRNIIESRGLQSRKQDAENRFFGLGLFDLEGITDLPIPFLELMSWSLGEETKFLSKGDLRGWPLRITPISQRPFLKIDGRYYCFNVFGLFDNLYRTIQKTVCAQKPERKITWNSIQKSNTEELPLHYFEIMLPGCRKLKDIYYKWHSNEGSTKKEWCETDGVVIYGDHLIVVEVKAGSFTYTSPTNDFAAYIKSIENLVLVPAKQGSRFMKYLDSADTVALYDSDKKITCEISKRDFRKITICALTIDPFTEIAAQIQHLKPLGIELDKIPVWSISLDDLRVCSDIFVNPLIFLHYLDQRMRAYENQDVNTYDELDHVGLYFEFNDYSSYASELRLSSNSEITFDGYRTKIDDFFHEKLLGLKHESAFSQNIPKQLLKILNFCSGNPKEFVGLASYLLDCSHDYREMISDGIEGVLVSQPLRKRLQVLSTTGEVRISIACWQTYRFPADPTFFTKQVKSELVCHGEENRKGLELYFDDRGEITAITWSNVTSEEISSGERIQFEALAGEMRARRVAQAKTANRKIGRNLKCPCGSNKKFKTCCGDRCGKIP